MSQRSKDINKFKESEGDADLKYKMYNSCTPNSRISATVTSETQESTISRKQEKNQKQEGFVPEQGDGRVHNNMNQLAVKDHEAKKHQNALRNTKLEKANRKRQWKLDHPPEEPLAVGPNLVHSNQNNVQDIAIDLSQNMKFVKEKNASSQLAELYYRVMNKIDQQAKISHSSLPKANLEQAKRRDAKPQHELEDQLALVPNQNDTQDNLKVEKQNRNQTQKAFAGRKEEPAYIQNMKQIALRTYKEQAIKNLKNAAQKQKKVHLKALQHPVNNSIQEKQDKMQTLPNKKQLKNKFIQQQVKDLQNDCEKQIALMIQQIQNKASRSSNCEGQVNQGSNNSTLQIKDVPENPHPLSERGERSHNKYKIRVRSTEEINKMKSADFMNLVSGGDADDSIVLESISGDGCSLIIDLSSDDYGETSACEKVLAPVTQTSPIRNAYFTRGIGKKCKEVKDETPNFPEIIDLTGTSDVSEDDRRSVSISPVRPIIVRAKLLKGLRKHKRP